MIWLHKNESPLSPFTAKELADLFEKAEIHRYPRQEYDEFVEHYAAQCGLSPLQVSLANGSDEWIQKLNILMPQGKMLMLDPDFTMYEEYARQFKREILKVEADDRFRFDQKKIIETIYREKPVFFIFSQPNNPLGFLYPQSFIDEACRAMKEVGGYCIVDEAYLQYSDPARKTITEIADHVIIMRTFSKFYGMAGLRVGIVISTEKTIAWLNTIAHPYPINSLTLTIANAFLADEVKQRVFFDEHLRLSKRLKEILTEELTGICEVLPSEANYVFTYGENAEKLGKYLFTHEFYLRIYDNPRLRGCVRYSIGTEEQLEALRQAIRDWKAQENLSGSGQSEVK